MPAALSTGQLGVGRRRRSCSTGTSVDYPSLDRGRRRLVGVITRGISCGGGKRNAAPPTALAGSTRPPVGLHSHACSHGEGSPGDDGRPHQRRGGRRATHGKASRQARALAGEPKSSASSAGRTSAACAAGIARETKQPAASDPGDPDRIVALQPPANPWASALADDGARWRGGSGGGRSPMMSDPGSGSCRESNTRTST